MLCSACKDLFQGRDAPWYYIKERDSLVPAYQHHPSPARLFRAANSGCHICLIIWRKLTIDERAALNNTWSHPFVHQLSQVFQRLWGIPIAYYSWSPIWWSKDDFGIRFQLATTHSGRRSSSGCFLLMMRYLIKIRPTTLPRSRTDSTTDPAQNDHGADLSMWTPHVQRLVQRWHGECTQSHDFCRIKDLGHIDENKTSTRQLPTPHVFSTSATTRSDSTPRSLEPQRAAICLLNP